jgi:TolB-like protein
VPDALSGLVLRCLEKRPEDRVQTTRDVYNDLRRIQRQLESGQGRAGNSRHPASAAIDPPDAAPATPTAVVVTVLPFVSPSPTGDAPELAGALAEALVVGLSRFSFLRVVKGSAPGDRPAAGYLLQGSVRAAGAVVRVVTQLSDAGVRRTVRGRAAQVVHAGTGGAHAGGD